MDKKYMRPPDQPAKPRVGPQFQAQIPELRPMEFVPEKRIKEASEDSTKKRNRNN